jgi:hypothetical protein
MLDQMAGGMGRAQNVGAGIGDVLKGLAIGYGRHKAGQAETAGNASGQSVFDSFLKTIGQSAPQTASPSAPGVPGGISAPQTQNGPVAKPTGAAMQGFGDGQTGQMVAQRLQKDFGLSPAAAAGFAGNLAHESGNFKTLQEINPTVAGSRGGFGWAQWTGPRRRQFESWAAQNGLNPSSPEANYGFLKNELQGSEGGVLAKLKGINDPAKAAQIVSQNYLRPGIPHMDSRIKYANQIAGAGQQVASSDPQQAFQTALPQPAAYQQPMEQQAQASPQAPMQQQPELPTQSDPSAQFNEAMKVYSNAWATPEMKQMALMTIQQEMQKQDPAYQMKQKGEVLDQTYKQAQIDNMAQGDVVSVGNRLVNRKTGQVVYDPPQDLTDKNEHGLQVVYGKDKTGNLVAMQTNKSGGLTLAPLPEGVNALAPGLDYLNTGTGFVPVDKRGGALPQDGVAQPVRIDVAGKAKEDAIGGASGAAQVAAPGDIAAADSALNILDQIETSPYLERGTGASSYGNMIPGTGGYDFQNLVDQSKSGAFATAIQQMRGLGSLSNAEGDTATKAINRMNTATSTEAFMQALNDYKAVVLKGKARAESRLKFGGPQPSAPEMSDEELLKKYGG